MFFGILLYVLLFGGKTRYIIESGISSLGIMMQNFISLATDTDPLRNLIFLRIGQFIIGLIGWYGV